MDSEVAFDSEGAEHKNADIMNGANSIYALISYKSRRYMPQEADEIRKRFFDIHTELWDVEYSPVGCYVVDGTSWKFSVRYIDGSIRAYSGQNAWPENWNKLLDLFGVNKREYGRDDL